MIYKTCVLLIFIFTVSCGGSSELVNNPPFKIEKIKKTNTEDGETISFVAEGLPRDLAFNTLFFQQKKSRVLWNEGESYYASFTLYKKTENRQLSLDMSKESKNKIPQMPVEVPHTITENQALLNYKLEGKNYYTILEIVQD